MVLGEWKRIPWGLRIAEFIWTFIIGGLLGAASGSVLLGGGFAAITRKLAFGDWDQGYAWTIYDLAFWTVSFLQGAAGAWLAKFLGLHKIAEEQAIRTLQYVDRFHPVTTRVPGENEGSYTWFVSNESPHA